MITLTECPLCGGRTLTPSLRCVDYTVSRETFTLARCERCTFLMTNPRPDDERIGQYYQSQDYISHTNKASTVIDRIYLQARTFTLRWKLRLLENIKPAEKTLLDYGCGTGSFLHFIQNHNWRVNGVEPSTNARQIASNLIKQSIASTISELKDERFEVITLWHVLEHVPNLDQTIQQIKHCLNDNGTMFIAVPNHTSWDAEKYHEYWAGYDVPRHLWHFTQHTMKLLMAKHNLRIANTIPMKLDAYYVSLLSEKYKHQNASLTAMVKAFVNGVTSNKKASSNNEYSSLIYVIKK